MTIFAVGSASDPIGKASSIPSAAIDRMIKTTAVMIPPTIIGDSLLFDMAGTWRKLYRINLKFPACYNFFMELVAGTILGKRYRLQNSLGTGGMAMVFHAHDLVLERPVALKILRQDFSKQPGFRERFRQEARAAANLAHPNIVTVYDFGEDKENLFIVMEYIAGTDLKSILSKEPRLPLVESLRFMIQACSGLGYAHRAGIVHCDVKPQNMLVSKDNSLKITDFGIARALSTIKPEEASDIVWGSPIYFSPEQAQGKAPTPASDVYSLGVILYQMITGKPPFLADDAQELAILHSESEPRAPSEILVDLPMEINEIILKVLSKEPSARYRSADQMGRVLEAFLLRNHPSNGLFKSVDPLEEQEIFHRASTEPTLVKTKPGKFEFDWKTMLISLLALISVGGLIPFWLYVFLSIMTNR